MSSNEIEDPNYIKSKQGFKKCMKVQVLVRIDNYFYKINAVERAKGPGDLIKCDRRVKYHPFKT